MVGDAEMACSACGHATESGARFCAQCGSPVVRACPVCKHPVEPDARFCSNCGAALADGPRPADERGLSRYVPETLLRKIRTARDGGAMRGERRTVTMLFADIQGSTAAAERLDPEEWAEIVNGAFEHLIAPVYRYEGTLARLQGDAVLAFFGAPIAREDDPVRAVHVGLEMLESIRGYAADVDRRTGVPIAIRVGINTGLVVVGEVGSDLRVEYTALGDAINVAARMEQTAEPGTVRITETTGRLLGDAFILAEIGPVEVKGRSEPVLALRADGVASTVAAGTATTPLLGRDRERAALHSVLQATAAGIGGIVTLIGEAGIGKSRLLIAMREDGESGFDIAATNRAPGEIAWFEGSSRSFDAGVAYTPFIDAAARWLDLDDLGDVSAFQRITEAIAGLTDEPDPDMATFLGHAVGAPLPPEAAALVDALDTPVLHERTANAIISYLEAEAARRPLVIVLNDLHWADALSLALAERLIDSAERVPIALVLALRPVREEPAWRLVEKASREANHRHTPIELDALDATTTDALLELLLGGSDVSAEDRQRLLQRADGNPLFVEELAGSVTEVGAPEVPDSLSGLLGARLDRLDDDTRLVAEVAAVVGREFEPAAVAALVDDVDVDAVLADLVRKSVLTEQRRLPRPLFAFRHALIQEAAYNIVLLRDRRELHARLASHLEASNTDAPHEIARHHLASDQPDAAFPWLVEAGRRANRAMSPAEAIRLFTTALDHVPAEASPDDVGQAHLGLGEAYSLVPDLDHASSAYQSLADLGRTTGHPSLEVRALNRLGFNAAVFGSDFTAATDYLDRARTVAEGAGDELGLAEYHMNACFVAVAQGEFDDAVAHDVETARLGAANGSDQIRVTGLMRRAMNLIAAAEFDDVGAAMAEARQAALEVGSEESLAIITALGEAVLRERDGELAASLELMAGSRETLARYGSFYTAIVQAAAGRMALWLGDIGFALSLLAEAVRTAEANGQAFATSGASATLARCYAVCGDVENSRQQRKRALEALTLPVGDYLASTVWADLALAGIEQGDWSEVEADLTVGLQTSSSSRFWERPRLLAGTARVALERGDAAKARDLLDEAVAYTAQRGMRAFDADLEHLAGLIARAEGDLVAADAAFVAAETAAERMGMRLLACELAAERADIAAALGQDAEATTHRERHGQLADGIVGALTDAGLRAQLRARLGGSVVSPSEPSSDDQHGKWKR